MSLSRVGQLWEFSIREERIALGLVLRSSPRPDELLVALWDHFALNVESGRVFQWTELDALEARWERESCMRRIL